MHLIYQRYYNRYFLRIRDERTEVCKKTFMDTHQIKRGVLQTVVQNLNNGSFSVQDGRGKHDHHKCVDQVVRDAIRRHIFQFTFEPIHYSRRSGDELCLPPDFNVARMYSKFKDENPEIGNRKEWLYREVFLSTGIKLNKPKSDTCRTCDKLRMCIQYPENAEEERIATENMHEHQIKADLGYAKLYDDIAQTRNNLNLVVTVVDLQKVLFSPTLTHQDMYYMRQFSSYNLCIYNGEEDQGYMYFWNESEAKRGVNEMGSAFLHYIKSKYTPLNAYEERKLIVWSDRCRGQFNNYPMLCLFLYLINQRYFTEIEQKFLVSGHSYMPCDRLFGLIEKRKRVTNAYVPDQWIKIIEESRPSHPFHVTRLTQEMVVNIQSLKFHFRLPPDLKVSEIAIAQLSRALSGQILTRSSHLSEAWMSHPLYAPHQPHRRRQNRDIMNIMDAFIGDLQQCYFHPLPLSAEKKENLTAMLPFLPPEYRLFFEDVLNV